MQESQRDLLILEYQVSHDGYKYRDALVPRQFAYMLQTFFGFLLLAGTAKAVEPFERGVSLLLMVAFGITGAISLATFFVDMQANVSCKRALRRRASQIEKELGSKDLQYWKTIAERQMFWIEDKIKAASRGPLEASSSTGYICASFLLMCLWVFLVVMLLFWGQPFVPKA